MRETMTFVLAVLLAVPLLAGDGSDDELVMTAKRCVTDYSLTPPDSIGGVIEKALPGVANARQLVAIVRERFGLKDETARRITIAALHSLTAVMRMDQPMVDSVRDLEREYAEALRSDASNAAVAREYLAFLAEDDNHVPDAGKRIRDVLRGLPRDQRGIVALQVMSDGRFTHVNAALFEAVSESYGADPLALAIAGDELTSSSNAELFDRATALWLARKDVESAAAAASRAIYAYANGRSLADVLRIYRSLPDAAKAIVSSAPASEATVRSRGVERRIGTRDIRFTLAAAFILSGDDRAALPLVPRLQAKTDDAEGQSNAATTAILRAAIASPGGDAFDLVTSYLQHANTTALVDEVFDVVATRAGYAAASKWRLTTVTRADERLSEAERLVASDAVVALLPLRTTAAEQADAISPSMARLLNRAPRLLFERPVDDSARFDAASRIVRPLPMGFGFLRMEARGNEIVAVAEAQGGYWILRSFDRGATWNPPLFTGLRMMQPYEVVIGSTLPMLRDDGVRIEVAIKGVEDHRIALDLKWRVLERDSDGDGLTDLMEERVFTDPNSADTDGDGLPDGVDPLPQVAFRQSSGDVSGIIAAAIETYCGSDQTGARTIFVAGDPADFAGVKSRLRIIVLNEAEVDAAAKKFGSLAATRMSPVIIDQSGTRAWVQLSDESSGATYLLEKRNGVWTPLLVASWVS
ncbi:MAG: hypothetical protein QOF63_3397 [Thermoanaerobaculia bacterium]|jgi:hypothetical protein|nr:hypothetical protein [Thermoanaerobaculia bacterium]